MDLPLTDSEDSSYDTGSAGDLDEESAVVGGINESAGRGGARDGVFSEEETVEMSTNTSAASSVSSLSTSADVSKVCRSCLIEY